MASFFGTRFPGPMFNNPSFLGNNFNINSVREGFPRPQFQGPPPSVPCRPPPNVQCRPPPSVQGRPPPSVPCRPFQAPNAFMHGQFQNRPHFSNFQEPVRTTTNFGNRLPPPPPNPLFHTNTPSNQVFRLNPPAAPNQVFRMPAPASSNEAFRLTAPPRPSEAFRMSAPPRPNEAFRMTAPPRPSEPFHMTAPPRPSEPFRMTAPPRPSEPFRMTAPPPSNQLFRMNSPHHNQVFNVNPTPSVPRPRFGGHFERPYRPWKQPSSFGSPKHSYQNHSRTIVQSQAFKDLPLQANKKRKQKTREFRKLKEDPTEKPFSCDTCDRAFVTEDELSSHISQHIKCDRENCKFEAHPKIVALHQKMQHDTGYADKISRLKNDAEIKKWREERKRRFPTAENIKKRIAEKAEKEARGEVLETREFGKFKRGKEENGHVVRNENGKRVRKRCSRRYNKKRIFQNHPSSKPFSVNIAQESDSDSDTHITIKQFAGIFSMKRFAQEMHSHEGDIVIDPSPLVVDDHNEKQNNFTNSDVDHSISQPDVVHADVCSNDHTSVVLNNNEIQECIFLDESCEPDEYPNEDISVVHEFAPLGDTSVCEISQGERASVKPEVVTLDDSSDSDEGPTALPIVKCTETSIVDDGEKNDLMITNARTPTDNKSKVRKENKFEKNFKGDRKRKETRQNNRQNPVFESKRNGILEKLLADDIRHERNVILQCIRNIVNNNFFGIDDKKL